jgi:hypothetical protein
MLAPQARAVGSSVTLVRFLAFRHPGKALSFSLAAVQLRRRFLAFTMQPLLASPDADSEDD